MTYDVSLPIGQIAKFPDRCINCGEDNPGDSLKYDTNAVGWWTVVFVTFGKKHVVNVPACKTCKIKLRRKRLLRMSVCLLFVVVGVMFSGWILKSYHGPFKFHISCAIAFIALIPFIAWEIVSPPQFDMTAFSNTIDYEFKDSEYAFEFRMINTGPMLESKTVDA